MHLLQKLLDKKGMMTQCDTVELRLHESYKSYDFRSDLWGELANTDVDRDNVSIDFMMSPIYVITHSRSKQFEQNCLFFFHLFFVFGH